MLSDVPHRSRRRIPDATVARLPIYLQLLIEQLENEVANISSDELATLAAVNAAKVRKDLSYMGSYGTRVSGTTSNISFTKFGANSASTTSGASSSLVPAT